MACAPIGRIRPTFDQACRFEVIEQVGHDGAVDTEMLRQGQLAPHHAMGRRGEDLVATRPAREVGHRGVRRRDVGPKDRAEAPPEICGQGVVTSAGVAGSLPLTREVAHAFSIRALKGETESLEIFCLHDGL